MKFYHYLTWYENELKTKVKSLNYKNSREHQEEAPWGGPSPSHGFIDDTKITGKTKQTEEKLDLLLQMSTLAPSKGGQEDSGFITANVRKLNSWYADTDSMEMESGELTNNSTQLKREWGTQTDISPK